MSFCGRAVYRATYLGRTERNLFRSITKSINIGLLLPVVQTRFYSMTQKDSVSGNDEGLIVCPPESVRGMTELDKEKFRKTIAFPTLSLDTKYMQGFFKHKRFQEFAIKGLKNIKYVSDTDGSSTKLLVFDPDKCTEDSKRVVEDILKETSKQELQDFVWSSKDFEVAFDNWDMRRCIRAVLPKELDFSGYTQSGHIVHCNFRDEILPYRFTLGQIILEKVAQCRTVVNKLDSISSTFRNFELELIAGEADYVTTVAENNIKYKMDFSKVFWNSRLSHEHERVWKLFNNRSLVYDACAGIGPFVLPALRQSRTRNVLANDLNPESVVYLKENIKLNKLSSAKINVFNMDAVEFIRGPVADDLVKEIQLCTDDAELTPPSGAHITMNLPAYSVNFLPAFYGMLKGKFEEGKEPISLPFPITVYSYLFAKAHEDVPDSWFAEKAREMVREKIEHGEPKIVKTHHVRTVSSRKEMYCVQIELSLEHLLGAEEDRTGAGTERADGDERIEGEPVEKKSRVEA